MPDEDFVEKVITAIRDDETMMYNRVVPTQDNLSGDGEREYETIEVEPEDVVHLLAREAVVSRASVFQDVGTVVDE